MDIQMVTEFIQNFGFPIAVACWALWRLDKNWGKGETIQATLSNIEESLDKVELTLHKNTEILTELVTTIRILQSIISQQQGGEKGK